MSNYNYHLQSNNIDLQTILQKLQNKAAGGGGSITIVRQKDVNFYDYDGTLLYSYTVEEAKTLTELPSLPSQPGLVCQGWNYDLETIKSYNRPVDVGANYTTDDGKTRLYIRIAAEGRMNVPLSFYQSRPDGVAIDWGDGTDTETVSTSGEILINHTYTEIGNYMIALDLIEGSATLGATYDGKNIMGPYGGMGSEVYFNMLYKVEFGRISCGPSAFAKCAMLNSIAINREFSFPTATTASTFNECYNLKCIILPDGNLKLPNGVFQKCYSLMRVSIPDSVTSIDSSAFNNCKSLRSIAIPDSVTSIGKRAFDYCESLTNVTLPNSVTSIGDQTFNNCTSLISVTIPDSVTSIGYSAFQNCKSLRSIAIPDSVTSIGDQAFQNCSSLTSVTIGDSVTSIGDYAFARCLSLASVVIPKSVTEIQGSAFYQCYCIAIYDFTSHISVPTLSDTKVFQNISSDCIIKIPAALYDEWIAATNWSTYASYIVAV